LRALIQKVSKAHVTIDGQIHGGIGKGFVIFLGIKKGDDRSAAEYLAEKCSHMRVFEDESEKMNLSLIDVDGRSLIISQFTLYADAQKGNRPGFSDAARPEEAEPLYEHFVARMKANLGEERVATGVFRAMMEVHLVNDGPVTIMIESKN